MREMPRLGISPNLLHYVPQTSHNPDVVSNFCAMPVARAHDTKSAHQNNMGIQKVGKKTPE
ncbi:MAG: hypothetical protein R3B71_05955 [Candidatus Gracilibacteria bacterium]